MTWGQLKLYFKNQLKSLYHEREITAMFSLYREHRFEQDMIVQFKTDSIELSNEQRLIAEKDVAKLTQGVPYQQVVGFSYFLGLKLLINQHVLIPRPETEELVAKILERVEGNHPKNILDIGTGSGCITLALKNALPTSQVFAWDLSLEALKVARSNAKNLQLDVNFFQADILTFNEKVSNPFDVVVSNPPYIPASEIAEMDKNVRDYEPHLALFVGDDDPLIFYRKIAKYASQNLSKNGHLAFETHYLYAQQVKELLEEMGFTKVVVEVDLYGKDRFVFAVLNTI